MPVIRNIHTKGVGSLGWKTFVFTFFYHVNTYWCLLNNKGIFYGILAVFHISSDPSVY